MSAINRSQSFDYDNPNKRIKRKIKDKALELGLSGWVKRITPSRLSVSAEGSREKVHLLWEVMQSIWGLVAVAEPVENHIRHIKNPSFLIRATPKKTRAERKQQGRYSSSGSNTEYYESPQTNSKRETFPHEQDRGIASKCRSWILAEYDEVRRGKLERDLAKYVKQEEVLRHQACLLDLEIDELQGRRRAVSAQLETAEKGKARLMYQLELCSKVEQELSRNKELHGGESL